MTNNKNIKKAFSKFYQYFIFLVAVASILMLYPKEAKFKYEFSKGKPWLHETLIAPFDFPIYKFKNEIEDEADSISKSFKPYFKFNSKIQTTQTNRLKQDFEGKWNDHITKYYRIVNDTVDSNSVSQREIVKNEYLNYISNILNFIYQKGVVELSDVLGKVKNDFSIFIINQHAEAKEFDISEVFTLTTAKDYIENEIHERRNDFSYTENIDIKFLEELKLQNYIETNLFYDNDISQSVKKSMIENISLTKGLVQKNERIISKGEVVNIDSQRILESLKKEYEHGSGINKNYILISTGQGVLIFIILLILFLFLQNFRKDILESFLKITFLLLMVISFVAVATIIIKFDSINPYIIPFALLPIIIRTFYDTRLALITHLITMFLIAFIFPNSYEFTFMQFITGAIAIFSLANVRKRSQLFLTAFIIFATYSSLYIGIGLMQEGNFTNIKFDNIIWFAGNGLLLLSSYPIIYIFEKLFGFLSDVTLMELSDTNHPILRKLAEKAPGTFQHSLQVANLAEELAYRLEANPLLARVGAMYHDIGKMESPIFFIENQKSGINPHDEIDCEKSAEIIINHVKNGVSIAKRHRIPQQIIDFIRTHHGKSRVEYFYRTFINQNPDVEVDENKFTYPGISPYSKETAIVMMADSVEAASRSLKEITEENVKSLINNIINKQIEANQFVNADITFRDISRAKEILTNKILNINHARIEYPKEIEEKGN